MSMNRDECSSYMMPISGKGELCVVLFVAKFRIGCSDLLCAK